MKNRWPILAATAALTGSAAFAQLIPKEPPSEIRGMDVVERLGERVPMDLEFVDQDGKKVRLGDYFPPMSSGKNARPAVIKLVYYRCPIVCTTLLQKLMERLNEIDYQAGKDYNVLVFSFDYSEGPVDAKAAQIGYGGQYKGWSNPDAQAGFAFHTGDAAANRALADAVGFPYRKLDNGEYSHPVATIFLSPEGKVVRYHYGFEVPAEQMKLALLDASQGKLAKSFGDRILHFCFRYDPNAGKYTLAAMRVMQVGGLASMGFLSVLIGGLLVVDRVRKGRRAAVAASPSAVEIVKGESER